MLPILCTLTFRRDKAMLKSIIYASLFILIYNQTAFAGDFAEREIIGFSKDGSKFAFEEFGVQDGSGFAYSNIYIIDIKTDRWVDGSPWRVQINDENVSLSAARNKNLKLAFHSIKNVRQKGFVAATNRYTEIQEDPSRFRAHPRSFIPSGARPLEYKLENYPATPKTNCSGIDNIMGFKLTQILSTNSGTQKRVLHKDSATLPNSRGCPLDYSFADLVTYYPKNGPPVAAILLLKRSYGFEGPDGRYLAITAPIE